jgi:hypothetical protein
VKGSTKREIIVQAKYPAQLPPQKSPLKCVVGSLKPIKGWLGSGGKSAADDSASEPFHASRPSKAEKEENTAEYIS